MGSIIVVEARKIPISKMRPKTASKTLMPTISNKATLVQPCIVPATNLSYMQERQLTFLRILKRERDLGVIAVSRIEGKDFWPHQLTSLLHKFHKNNNLHLKCGYDSCPLTILPSSFGSIISTLAMATTFSI